MSRTLLGGVGRLQHVVADELVEVADRLHRDGLVKQLHRLLGPDAEQAPDRRAYSGNTLWISAPPARSRRRRSVRSEPKSVKSASIDSCFVEVTKKRSGWPARSCWWNTWARVTVSSNPSLAKTPSTTEYVPVVAQPDLAATCRWPRSARTCSGPRRRTAQGAFLGVGSGCLVVGDPLCGGSSSVVSASTSVDLPLPMSPVSSAVARLGRQPPDPLVEGAPVEHLESVQPVAGPGRHRCPAATAEKSPSLIAAPV